MVIRKVQRTVSMQKYNMHFERMIHLHVMTRTKSGSIVSSNDMMYIHGPNGGVGSLVCVYCDVVTLWK